MNAATPLIQIRDLSVIFESRDADVHAVNGIDFELVRGETLCILGESGSGKSVTLKAILQLLPPRSSRVSGAVLVDGEDVLTMTPDELSQLRGGKVAMIFQEPALSFDPVYTVGEQIIETILRHERTGRRAARKRALELMELVHIPSPERRLKAYPHELSGGMRQRAMIALALSCQPDVLLADEPTTALDASVQIQVLLLLRELQRELGMSVIFVTHDVGVAVEIADRIAVMYAGRFVEMGLVREVIRNPRHPYTQGLLASTVQGAMRGTRLEAIQGSPPDLARLPPGCSFAPRCKLVSDRCRAQVPEIRTVGADHLARCIEIEVG
jgi:peptide/nickel transport system ATP-binding protein